MIGNRTRLTEIATIFIEIRTKTTRRAITIITQCSDDDSDTASSHSFIDDILDSRGVFIETCSTTDSFIDDISRDTVFFSLLYRCEETRIFIGIGSSLCCERYEFRVHTVDFPFLEGTCSFLICHDWSASHTTITN